MKPDKPCAYGGPPATQIHAQETASQLYQWLGNARGGHK